MHSLSNKYFKCIQSQKVNIILENTFGNDKLYIVSAINTSNEYKVKNVNIILENSFGNDKLYIVSAINTSNEYKVKKLNIILEK